MNIDFHAHVLPGADHGSANLDTSLKQLALAKQAGIDHVIATPHFYPRHDAPERFLKRRAEAEAALRDSRSAAASTALRIPSVTSSENAADSI